VWLPSNASLPGGRRWVLGPALNAKHPVLCALRPEARKKLARKLPKKLAALAALAALHGAGVLDCSLAPAWLGEGRAPRLGGLLGARGQ
jgi:hypothetical protein